MTEVHLGGADNGEVSPLIGQRIVVTGMAGAGKSTFAKALRQKTGLPLIHLDLHYWNPGWVRVPQDEFYAKQEVLLGTEQWIVDSNDVDTGLLKKRADTLFVIDTPWWICAWRAFKRGLRRPPDTRLPDGCEELALQRLSDEWGIVWRNWHNRKAIRHRELGVANQCQSLMTVHILKSTDEIDQFLNKL